MSERVTIYSTVDVLTDFVLRQYSICIISLYVVLVLCSMSHCTCILNTLQNILHSKSLAVL